MVRIFIILLLSVSCFLGQVNESQLKAAILLKIIKTIEWPDSDHPELTIAVLGNPDFANELKKMASGNPNFASMKIVAVETIPRNIKFDVLFIATTKNGKILGFCESIRKEPILIVSDQDQGKMEYLSILLDLEGQHIAFDVNLTNLEEKKLRINSRVLKLARKVYY